MAEALYRAIEILRLIPTEPASIDTTQIHKRLSGAGLGSVTPRTIQRTLESLSGQFALRCNDEAKPHRWSRMRESPLIQIPAMSPPLALTLKLAEGHLSRLLPRPSLSQLAPYFQIASQALGAASRGGLSQWPAKIRALPRGPHLRTPIVSESVQNAVSLALLEDRSLRVTYRSREAEKLLRYVVHPLALVHRDPVVYLVCVIGDHEDIRQLALHRIKEAEALGSPARRVKDFDIDRYIATGAFGYEPGRQIRLEAAFNRYVAQHLIECPLSADQRTKDIGKDRVLVRASILDTNELRWWLLGFGAFVEVRKPLSLRRWIIEELRRSARNY